MAVGGMKRVCQPVEIYGNSCRDNKGRILTIVAKCFWQEEGNNPIKLLIRRLNTKFRFA